MTKQKYNDVNYLREQCLESFKFFCRLMVPERVFADIHFKLMEFFQDETKPYELALLPRGHQKSYILALYCVWWITKNPTESALYVSANDDLAELQVSLMKQVLLSERYKTLFPEMINYEYSKDKQIWVHAPKGKWTQKRFSIDHPDRLKRFIRDDSVVAVSSKTTLTGFHAGLILGDDLVTEKNYKTEQLRNDTISDYETLTRLANPNALFRVVGTTYHPKDLNSILMERVYDVCDDDGEITGRDFLYNTMKEPVETNGVFLWPYSKAADGHWYGFNWRILNLKKADVEDIHQYYAQYYLNPNPSYEYRLAKDKFRYYNPSLITRSNGCTRYANKKLYTYGCVDLAFSKSKRADYTALVIIGLDCDFIRYVLEIYRFKTTKLDEQVRAIEKGHDRWGLRQLWIEANGPQKGSAEYIKEKIKLSGNMLKVDFITRSRHEGAKEQRIASVLEPLYRDGLMAHGQITDIDELESQLMLPNPTHDDVKDALAGAVEKGIVAPPKEKIMLDKIRRIEYNTKFGGIL